MRTSFSAELAGLGGDVKYLRMRGRAQKFWNLANSGFIFSLLAEGGTIIPLQDRPGTDDILLTDRFFLGEPQFRGFDIRGVGPRILTQPYITDENGDRVPVTDRESVRDDALGGRNYYLARAEVEIPLSSGARELGLRPSVWVDVGALWGIDRPLLQDNPNGVQQLDTAGNPIFIETGVNDQGQTITFATINPIAADGITANVPSIRANSSIREVFLGDTPTPRITAGIGVNWNSPFGPFRIDFAQSIRRVEGDDDKTFTFNVGTQF
jgi:outer membrane protein insertion porin family